MSKLKLIYKLLPIPLAIITVFAIYVAYNCWQDEKTAQDKVTELTNKIEQLEQKAESDNQTIGNNELTKSRLDTKSQERSEKMNEQLKDNDCANRFAPMSISGSLYNRAKSLRESTDTSKPIK